MLARTARTPSTHPACPHHHSPSSLLSPCFLLPWPKESCELHVEAPQDTSVPVDPLGHPCPHGSFATALGPLKSLRTPLSPWVRWDSPGTTEVPQDTPVPTVSPSGHPCARRSSGGTSGSTQSPARAWQVPRPPEAPPLPPAPPPCPICSVVVAWKDRLPLPVYPEVHRRFSPPPWGAPFCSGCHFRTGILMVGLDDPQRPHQPNDPVIVWQGAARFFKHHSPV